MKNQVTIENIDRVLLKRQIYYLIKISQTAPKSDLDHVYGILNLLENISDNLAKPPPIKIKIPQPKTKRTKI